MTARTAAELREAFIEGVLDELPPQSMFRKVNPNSVGKLDELLAAARAEAVAPLEARVKELERDLALMTHSRDGFREAVIAGESTRARVKELTEVLRQLVDAQARCMIGACGDPECTGCDAPCTAPATRVEGAMLACDRHGEFYQETDTANAAPLRAALALLAADQSDAGKAGKP